MNATGAPPELRPLGIGEVLDRAVTLCVRFFVPLALVYLVFEIPYAVVAYFATRDLQGVLNGFSVAVQTAGASGKPVSPHVFDKLLLASRPNGWSVGAIVLLVVFGPLAGAAMIAAVAARYLGEPTAFARAYGVAFARWMPLIVVNLMYVALGIVAYVVVGIALLAVILVVALLAQLLVPLAVVAGIVFGLLFLALVVAAAAVVVLAWQVSCFAVVVEREGPLAAFARGMTRVFSRAGFKRSLLAGCAYVAIVIGIAVVSLTGQSLLVGILHNSAAGVAYAAIVRVATAAFLTAFAGIFYFDLRVREEGLDLALAAQRVEGAPPSLA